MIAQSLDTIGTKESFTALFSFVNRRLILCLFYNDGVLDDYFGGLVTPGFAYTNFSHNVQRRRGREPRDYRHCQLVLGCRSGRSTARELSMVR